MRNFNSNLFNALSNINYYKSINAYSIESVLNVLNQRSDTARKDSLNHNCQINDIPFCWDYYTGYGDDSKQIKVVSFPMRKISTGWNFYLDIEESGNLYISEGKGTRRTQIKLADLNAFSWTTRESIKFVLEHLLNSNTESTPTPEEIFYFYKQVLNDYSSLIKTPYHKWNSETNNLYKKVMIDGIWESAHFQYDKTWKSPNPYDDAVNNPECWHLIMVRWSTKWNCWYADFVFNNSAWGFNCLNDAGSYQIDDGTFKLNLIDEETGEIDKETIGYKICNELKAELESAVKTVSKKENCKSGSWIYVPRTGYAYRKWSEIPEKYRIKLFVAAGDSANYYDDIEELDFTPEDDPENPDMARLIDGCCRYKYHHPDED